MQFEEGHLKNISNENTRKLILKQWKHSFHISRLHSNIFFNNNYYYFNGLPSTLDIL